jgi:hypothetical protein
MFNAKGAASFSLDSPFFIMQVGKLIACEGVVKYYNPKGIIFISFASVQSVDSRAKQSPSNRRDNPVSNSLLLDQEYNPGDGKDDQQEERYPYYQRVGGNEQMS